MSQSSEFTQHTLNYGVNWGPIKGHKSRSIVDVPLLNMALVYLQDLLDDFIPCLPDGQGKYRKCYLRE